MKALLCAAVVTVVACNCFVLVDDVSPSVRQCFAGIRSKRTTSTWRTRLQDLGRQDLSCGLVGQEIRIQSAVLGALLLCGGLWLAKVLTGHVETIASLLGSLRAGAAGTALAAAWGAGAGAFHSLSGPDHLAALAPLALRTSGPGRAFRQGAFWGFGHVLGQVLIGTSFLLLSQSQLLQSLGHAKNFAQLAEQFASVAVGIILMIIGGMGLKESRDWEEEEEVCQASPCQCFRWKTFGTGMLSGMHPDSLLLCLPALTMPTKMAGLIFLTSFGAGSMLAMGGFTAALRAACKSLGQQAVRRTSIVASLLALLLGATICATSLTVL